MPYSYLRQRRMLRLPHHGVRVSNHQKNYSKLGGSNKMRNQGITGLRL